MSNSRIGDVVSLIHKKALRGEIKWEQTQEGDYQATFPQSTVLIGQFYDSEARDHYTAIKIFNDRGLLVHEVHGGNIEQYVTGGSYKTLEEILEAAKESILKTSKTLEDILKALGE